MLRASRPTCDAATEREGSAKPTSRRLRRAISSPHGYDESGGFCDLQARDSVAVRIGCGIVGNGLDHARCVHVDGEEGFAEARVVGIDAVHVVDGVHERRYVDLVEVEPPDAVVVTFDAG